jgi:Kef-type K+ transport system membrane component KefB
MEPLPSWKTFFVELLLYAILLVVYFAFVLHYLGGWFKDLFDHDRTLFAVMALVIMIGQTVGLEVVSSSLIWLVRRKKKKKK